MKHVFLSYSRTDLTTMARIRDDFQAAGLSVWTDEQLEPGTPSWKDSIQEAIEEAGCVVVVLSPDAKKSPWVERELGYAASRGIKIFPVLARGTEQDAVPFELINAQWIDIRGHDAALQQKLIPAVDACLGRTTYVPPVLPSPPKELKDRPGLADQDFTRVLKFTDKELVLNRQHEMSLRQRFWTIYFLLDLSIIGMPVGLLFYLGCLYFVTLVTENVPLSAKIACAPATLLLIIYLRNLYRARDVLEVTGEISRSKFMQRYFLRVGKIKFETGHFQWKNMAGSYSGKYRAYYVIHGKFWKQLLSLEPEQIPESHSGS